MLQIGLTHGGGDRAVPIWLIHADKHAFDHVFRLLVEGVCFRNAATSCFQICEDRQIARHIITIADALACSEPLCSAGVGSGKISRITIQLCQFEHGVSFHSEELHLRCKLTGSFQVGDCLWFYLPSVPSAFLRESATVPHALSSAAIGLS